MTKLLAQGSRVEPRTEALGGHIVGPGFHQRAVGCLFDADPDVRRRAVDLDHVRDFGGYVRQ